MCHCNPLIRTPYCDSKECQDEAARVRFTLPPHEHNMMDQGTAFLRDQFALAVAPKVVEVLSPQGHKQSDWAPVKTIAATVYALADALIEARKKVRA